MMPRPCPSGSRLLKPFFDSKKIVYNGKMTRGIIMEVTRLLLLGPFYTIQMQDAILYTLQVGFWHLLTINDFLLVRYFFVKNLVF